MTRQNRLRGRLCQVWLLTLALLRLDERLGRGCVRLHHGNVLKDAIASFIGHYGVTRENGSKCVPTKQSHCAIRQKHRSRLSRNLKIGEQGWRNGENTCPPPVWPGFDVDPMCGLSLLLVFSLALRDFSPGYSGVLTIYTNHPSGNLVHTHKTIEFDVVRKRPSTKYPNQLNRL